ncbi:uncharacterized protein LOC125029747 [Penaeus chinensis]|uniref:uncharacterized protein LOC125029747 n=1 Tax=Penaeus chinensis TaxID=139456 RepID=UPI001FB58006|nr:uncharacterized protein LOC125029747 [Penaeus chinensis]XP_047475819.1 uncharacterized protein LOC125029747 [Penaeus chinensis]
MSWNRRPFALLGLAPEPWGPTDITANLIKARYRIEVIQDNTNLQTLAKAYTALRDMKPNARFKLSAIIHLSIGETSATEGGSLLEMTMAIVSNTLQDQMTDFTPPSKQLPFSLDRTQLLPGFLFSHRNKHPPSKETAA